MTNTFKDIDKFATACDQPPSEANYKMYLDLIREETDELEEAIQDNDKVEQLDALVDIHMQLKTTSNNGKRFFISIKFFLARILTIHHVLQLTILNHFKPYL